MVYPVVITNAAAISTHIGILQGASYSFNNVHLGNVWHIPAKVNEKIEKIEHLEKLECVF